MSGPRLEAIWIKRVRRGPMDAVDEAELRADGGIVGNANRAGRRQVTIIEREIWDALMLELDAELDPSARRANLMISGLSLRDSHERVLTIGGCRIRIMGETKPCRRMEEQLPGLEEAMWPNWAGGAFGMVLDDGHIRVGDPVAWAE